MTGDAAKQVVNASADPHFHSAPFIATSALVSTSFMNNGGEKLPRRLGDIGGCAALRDDQDHLGDAIPHRPRLPERLKVADRIAASISVTRCEPGPRVRVMDWASGRVRSGIVVRVSMGECSYGGKAAALKPKATERATPKSWGAAKG